MEITTASNSFSINGNQYAKGTLTVVYSKTGISIGNVFAKYDELTVDGVMYANEQELKPILNEKVFRKGGGTGGNGGTINAGFGLSKSDDIISFGSVTSVSGVSIHDVPLTDGEGVRIGGLLITKIGGKHTIAMDGGDVSVLMSGDEIDIVNKSTLKGISFDGDTGVISYNGNYDSDIPVFGLPSRNYVDDVSGSKVDKVDGKTLTSNDFTDAHKEKVEGLTDHFRGRHDTFDKMVRDVIDPIPGDYAHVVNDGPFKKYIWILDDLTWQLDTSDGGEETNESVMQKYESNPDRNAFTDAYKTAVNNATAHEANKNNPHNVTKAQVGLGNVDNTADMDKPLSTPQKEYIDSLHAGTPEGDKGTFSVNSAGQSYAIDLDGVADLVYTQIDALNGKWEYESKKQMLHRCMWVSLRTAAHEQVHIQENMNVGAIKVVDALYYGGGLEETYLRYVDEDGNIIKIYVIVEDSGKRCFWRKERW